MGSQRVGHNLVTEQQAPIMYIIIQNQKREVDNKKNVIILEMKFKSDELDLEKKQMTVRMLSYHS